MRGRARARATQRRPGRGAGGRGGRGGRGLALTCRPPARAEPRFPGGRGGAAGAAAAAREGDGGRDGKEGGREWGGIWGGGLGGGGPARVSPAVTAASCTSTPVRARARSVRGGRGGCVHARCEQRARLCPGSAEEEEEEAGAAGRGDQRGPRRASSHRPPPAPGDPRLGPRGRAGRGRSRHACDRRVCEPGRGHGLPPPGGARRRARRGLGPEPGAAGPARPLGGARGRARACPRRGGGGGRCGSDAAPDVSLANHRERNGSAHPRPPALPGANTRGVGFEKA